MPRAFWVVSGIPPGFQSLQDIGLAGFHNRRQCFPADVVAVGDWCHRWEVWPQTRLRARFSIQPWVPVSPMPSNML